MYGKAEPRDQLDHIVFDDVISMFYDVIDSIVIHIYPYTGILLKKNFFLKQILLF